MIKVAICDDENNIISQMEHIILEVSNKEEISVDIDAFYNAKVLEREVLSGTQYDVMYIETHMKNQDVINAARNIRKMDENVLIIFVSKYDKYLMEGFSIGIFNFVKRPINKELFINVFMEANRNICRKNFYFIFYYRGEEYKIPCNEILYFESSGRKIKVNLKNGEINVFNGKLSDIEIKLSEGKTPFIRIHQSYFVNFHLIRSRSKSKVTLINGLKLPISEDRQKVFGQNYERLLFHKNNL